MSAEFKLPLITVSVFLVPIVIFSIDWIQRKYFRSAGLRALLVRNTARSDPSNLVIAGLTMTGGAYDGGLITSILFLMGLGYFLAHYPTVVAYVMFNEELPEGF
jgi:hypothetical protein